MSSSLIDCHVSARHRTKPEIVRDRDTEILLKVKIQSKLNSHRQSVFVKTGSGLMLWYLER